MANIKADEITKILREQIENYQQTLAVDEVGSVISVGDGIARVHGLDKCMAGEMLAFPNDVFGIALNLEEDQVGVVLLGDYTKIEEGDVVKRTNKIMSVPVGDAMLGRVVDALGNPVDDKGPIQTDKRNALERLAPGVIDRQPVREPVQTGIKSIDAMIPIGRGPVSYTHLDVYKRQGRTLLPDGAIDTNHVAAALVDDRVQNDGGLSGLPVSDDQLALSAPDRNHRVNGLDSRLNRLAYRLPVNHACLLYTSRCV